mgnify:CR=1 FL=1
MELLKYLDRKEVLPFAGFAAAGAALLLMGFAYLPGFMNILFLTFTVSLTAVAVRNGIRLAYLEEENDEHIARLKRVTENMKEGVIIYTPEFRIKHMNKAAGEIFGVLPSDIENSKLTPNMSSDPKKGLLVQVVYPSIAPVAEELSGGWPQTMLIRTQNPSREFVTTTDRVLNEDGDVRGFVKIVQDKTREREIAESKSEFVSTTAHQLRTPLTGIKWAFDSLSSSVKDEELSKVISQGKELADRAVQMVNNMLDVAAIEGGEAAYDMKTVDIAEIVGDVVGEARNVADRYGIEISFDSSDEILVVGDKERLRGAVSVLIENAIKYNTDNGSVDVRLVEEKGWAHLSVRDTGIGISEEEQKHLFEKFYRGTAAKEIDPQGSGLGLYIVKSVVNAHRGKVWMESVKDRGSTFHITLPTAKPNTPIH